MASIEMFKKIATQAGFIAALDQSGGSSPKALALYGIEDSQFDNNTEMFNFIHQMRCRIVTSPVFTGQRILGAILFEDTLDREIANKNSASYLWQEKQIVPFLKIDQGLANSTDGVQLMKPIHGLAKLLNKAVQHDVFGTKMRSLITQANGKAIHAAVEQQFSIAKQVLSSGLTPIIEPEIAINTPDKAAAESLLSTALLTQLDLLTTDQQVMLKVTPPEINNFYSACITHPRVLKVVALSGGYKREHANEKVAANTGMIASFSRALTEGLSICQTEQAFNARLDASIEAIYQASKT